MNAPSEPSARDASSRRVGTALGLAALVLALVTITLWIRHIRAVDVPDNHYGYVAAFLGALILGIAAFVKGTRWYGGFAAAIAMFIGGLLTLTFAVSRQEVAEGAIAVGDVIPAFTSVDEYGEPFDSNVLHGHLKLIKFFRAHW